jgi:hypothetical protein
MSQIEKHFEFSKALINQKKSHTNMFGGDIAINECVRMAM